MKPKPIPTADDSVMIPVGVAIETRLLLISKSDGGISRIIWDYNRSAKLFVT